MFFCRVNPFDRSSNEVPLLIFSLEYIQRVATHCGQYRAPVHGIEVVRPLKCEDQRDGEIE